jgi:hypothetical protein
VRQVLQIGHHGCHRVKRGGAGCEPDTVSTVGSALARRARACSPQPVVNNRADVKKLSREQNLPKGYHIPAGIASRSSRSCEPVRSTTGASLPDCGMASVKKSERTNACEAPCIRLTQDSAPVPKNGGANENMVEY